MLVSASMSRRSSKRTTIPETKATRHTVGQAFSLTFLFRPSWRPLLQECHDTLLGIVAKSVPRHHRDSPVIRARFVETLDLVKRPLAGADDERAHGGDRAG